MTAEERQRVGTAWVDIAEIIGAKITRQQISRMIDSVDHLPASRVIEFLNDWLASPNARKLPLPADILQAMGERINPRAEAVEAATRIIQAVSDFGWAQGSKARPFIGELGWRAVERIGGWSYLCENLGTTLPLTTIQAQVRDLCESTILRAQSGLNEAPGFPEITNGEAGEILNLIETKKGDGDGNR